MSNGEKKPKALIPAKWPYRMLLFMLETLEGNRYTENGLTELMICHHLEAGARVVMLLMSLEFQRLQTKNTSRILFKALGEKYKNIKFLILKRERHSKLA